MDQKFKEISGRYDDVVCGVSDYQMFRDIRSLLAYIDQLHSRLVEQAAEDAVRATFLSLGDGADQRVH
ncbi:MAG: hypothetical protein P1P84_00040 [Deferrisomatales bacterium]|nr:hypothetical protein [Deferrisomatales bacterium]